MVITLANGEALRGTVGVIGGQRVADCLNNADQFLDFESHEGKEMLISKRTVSVVKTIATEAPNQLKHRSREISLLDPWAVLGLEKGAGREAIKQAYHQLARLYHPDRFANLDLPKEMREYANAMLTRINLAYEQLTS